MRSKPLILLADDDRQICNALAARLTQAGFDVAATSSAKEAIDVFDDRGPDAAILDVNMPDSDGLSVCEHVRNHGSSIPVFILTGADEGIIRNNLGKLTETVGANHFITKPYDSASVVSMLRTVIDSHRQGSAAAHAQS